MNKRTISVFLLMLMVALVLSTAASAATFGTRSLVMGLSGPDVMELQLLLEKQGFNPGPIDGIFGNMTHSAVLAYQRATGLPVVGRVGPQTTSMLLNSSLHTVQRGESLFLIARSYNTSIEAIWRANNLQTDLLLIGQRLSIPRGQALSVTSPSLRASITAHERDLIARIVHAEAQGEPYAGMVAVAAVIFNRVDSNQFPNTVSGVIYQPYQFEPVLNGWANKPAGADAYRAVDDALRGQDPSHGAVFFYNPAKAPHAWMATRPVIVRIGNHVFMR